MKKLKYLIAISCLALCSCDNEDTGIYVSSTIAHKSEHHYTTVILAGKCPVPVTHYYYYFHFNDAKPYQKSVSSDTYGKYEIGDVYTFQISEKEKEYFFTDNIDDISNVEKEALMPREKKVNRPKASPAKAAPRKKPKLTIKKPKDSR